jgi:hypothetical protein
MTHFSSAHRFPFAGGPPIDDAAARSLFASTLAVPRRPETVVVLLDHDRRGRTILNVAGTTHPDAVLDVAECCIELVARSPLIGGAIIATVRPSGGDVLDDVERWLDLDERFALVGVELVEWYVYGRAVSRPRVLLGEPDRWVA